MGLQTDRVGVESLVVPLNFFLLTSSNWTQTGFHRRSLSYQAPIQKLIIKESAELGIGGTVDEDGGAEPPEISREGRLIGRLPRRYKRLDLRGGWTYKGNRLSEQSSVSTVGGAPLFLY